MAKYATYSPNRWASIFSSPKVETVISLSSRRSWALAGMVSQSGMSEEEQLSLLASDGMLVKRPILVGDGFVLTGFRPGDWEEKL